MSAWDDHCKQEAQQRRDIFRRRWIKKGLKYEMAKHFKKNLGTLMHVSVRGGQLVAQ